MIAKDPKSMHVDKQALQQRIQELNEELGIVFDPTATAQKAREMMLADGIRPEDNIGSREIIRMRYGCEDEE